MKKLNDNLFTNDKCNNIIRKDYNPLKVNCKIYESEGLPMRKIKNVKKFKKLLEKICEDFNVQDSKKVIENFMKK